MAAQKKLSIVIGLEGGKEIQRQLKDIGEEGQKAFLEIAKAAEKVGGFTKLDLDKVTAKLQEMGVTGVKELNKIGAALDTAISTEKLQASVRTLETGLGLLSGGLAGLVRNFGLVGGAVSTVEAAFNALAGAAAKAREAIVGIDQAAIKMGQSVQQFDRLKQGFEKAGISAKALEGALEGIGAAADKAKLDGVTAAIKGLTAASSDAGTAIRARPADFRVLQDAAAGIGPAADKAREALLKLGQPVPIATTKTLSEFIALTGDVTRGTAAFVEQLRQMPDSANRSALALDAFKTGGAEVVQALRAGGIEIDQFRQRSGELTQTAVNTAVIIEQSFNRSAAAFERFKQTGDVSQLGAVFAEVGVRVSASLSQMGQELDALISKIGELASSVGGAIWDSFASAGQAAIRAVGETLGWLIEKFHEAVQWAAKLFSAGGGGSPEGTAPGMAGGGFVRGPGSGTSDSILARLSRGEFVVNARAVEHWGSSFFAALNSLRRPPGFALGGPVSMPALAGAGGMNHVTIQFPGLPAIGGLRASQSVVDELQRAAAMAQVRSGGRKPSRYT